MLHLQPPRGSSRTAPARRSGHSASARLGPSGRRSQGPGIHGQHVGGDALEEGALAVGLEDRDERPRLRAQRPVVVFLTDADHSPSRTYSSWCDTPPANRRPGGPPRRPPPRCERATRGRGSGSRAGRGSDGCIGGCSYVGRHTHSRSCGRVELPRKEQVLDRVGIVVLGADNRGDLLQQLARGHHRHDSPLTGLRLVGASGSGAAGIQQGTAPHRS